MKVLKALLLILIIVVATLQRVDLFDAKGRDSSTYIRAVEEFLEGKNPYEWTVRSYNRPNDPWNHGFANLPGLLFVNSPLYLVHLGTQMPLESVWKVPVLLADLAIGFVIFKLLYKKNYYMAILGVTAWLLDPYLISQQQYTHNDSIAILCMLLGLYFLEEDDVLAGAFYALSIAFKSFPIILFPIFLMKSKNKLTFFTAAGIIGIALSLPFMKSINDFTTYIKGALLVHGTRAMQGRPFLFYISYYYKIELFQIISTKIYANLALFSGWLVSIVLLLRNKKLDKYILSLLCSVLFYLFTPVLNRTYLLWFMPVLIVALSKINFRRNCAIFYLGLGGFYYFYYWYLEQWKDGFHIWHP